jgi:hypothetical protein
MMNDRFSAQLRQHLLKSADERPADGQLATLIDRVADTPPHHPVLARLTWLPGRVGPFPSTALRYGLVPLALIAATVAAAILGVGSNAPFRSTVFEGTWTTIDPADGSTMTLTVAAGTKPAVRFVDEVSTGGACDLDPVKRFTADGTGEISGSRLVVEYPDGGGCGLMTVPIGGRYDYLDRTDTLVDQDDLRWVRVRGVDVPATEAPPTLAHGTEPPATTPEPTPDTRPTALPAPDCLEFDGGGTYRATAGDGVTVTVTVPAVDGSWSGYPDMFHLVRAPCGNGGPVMIEASIVTEVFADACDMDGATRPVSGASEAIEALVAQEGHDLTGPTDATMAGLPASRLDISVPAEFDATRCTNEMIRLWIGTNDTGIGPGETMTVYIVDVDGLAIAVHAPFSAQDMTPALIAEVDGIIASLQIEP